MFRIIDIYEKTIFVFKRPVLKKAVLYVYDESYATNKTGYSKDIKFLHSFINSKSDAAAADDHHHHRRRRKHGYGEVSISTDWLITGWGFKLMTSRTLKINYKFKSPPTSAGHQKCSYEHCCTSLSGYTVQ
jgi:hypothetical protein